MDKLRFYFFAFAIALICAGRAEARLFSLVAEGAPVEEFGVDSEDASGRAVIIGTALYEIDPLTGEATFIGDTGYALCPGMDFHPFTNELYAVCGSNIVPKGTETKLVGSDDLYLVKIDIRTGEATEIGPTGIIPEGVGSITDISFRSDGVLFGHGKGDGGVILGTFNLKTGEFTLIGPAELNVRAGGVAFLPDGRLFSADTVLGTFKAMDFENPTVIMHLRDQATGDADFITDLKLDVGEQQFPYVTSLDTNPADGMLYGYVFDQSGILRSSTQRALEVPYIVTIDPDTGMVSWRASTIENVSAIAFLDIERNIPTMGEWGLMILASLMLLGSLLVLRRRQRRSVV